MKTGFCGIGKMGNEMVGRLRAAGHEVVAWNRTPSKLARVVALGARTAATPAAVARECDTVLLCIFDAASVGEVVFGPDGIASAGRPTLVVDHSSITPAATRDYAGRLRAIGGEWIDAPVSGGVQGAAAGRLTVMAGGSAAAIERASVAIRAYAARIERVGDVGAGQIAKLCNQAIVGAALLAVAEAVTLARDNGIDPARLPEILAGGWADSKVLQIFAPRMASPDGTAVATLTTLLKDIDSVAALACDTGTPLPVAGAVQQTLRIALAAGLGDADFSAIAQLFATRGTKDNATAIPQAPGASRA